MSRTLYAPKEQYTGNGSVAAYTFDFKIEALSQLEVIEMDDNGVETQRVRGDDVTYLTSVDFNSVSGGGTVNLAANLPGSYKLILLLANDAPTQSFLFSNKLSFSLKRFEAALDFILGPIQRLSYRAKQSIRIHDSEDEETFDTQLPPDILSSADQFLKVNVAGDGFEFGDVNEPSISNQINVTENQGSYSPGDVIPADTLLEIIVDKMLTSSTPPTLSLVGDGSLLVESGTLISPTLTPTYTANDAGPSNNYDLDKAGALLYNNATPAVYNDTPAFNIVDTSVIYDATVDYNASVLSAGSITSNTVTYVGARAAFFQVGGDKVNIRTNTETLIGVIAGSALVTLGDGVSLDCIFAYPASLGAPTSLFLSNTGGNFDITADLVTEATQMVNDASAANPVLYNVYSYTALIAIKVTDTLTLNI